MLHITAGQLNLQTPFFIHRWVKQKSLYFGVKGQCRCNIISPGGALSDYSYKSLFIFVRFLVKLQMLETRMLKYYCECR